jgi:hypothetical protein
VLISNKNRIFKLFDKALNLIELTIPMYNDFQPSLKLPNNIEYKQELELLFKLKMSKL